MASGRSLSLLPLHLSFLISLPILLATSTNQDSTSSNSIITFYNEEKFVKLATEEPVKASFFLARFAQSELEPKCQHKTKPIIVPVYFNSGGTVELPCKMCEWAFVVNGEPKAWKHIPLHHATAFLADPQKFLHEHVTDETYVQSLQRSLTPAGGGFHRRARLLKRLYREDASMNEGGNKPVPPAQKIASIHHFIQSDGKLYIHGTMLESSGIYFCHDKHSLSAHTRVFFLLTAMAPVVHHSTVTGSKEKASLWNVDDWLTSGQTSEPKCEEGFFANTALPVPMPDEFAHMRYTPAEFPTSPREMPVAVVVGVGSLKDDTNLEIDREFGEWTACSPQELFQYREVHCVLKRKEGTQIPENLKLTSYIRWAPELNAYFDKLPTLRLHSYFLASLIYKGHQYGDQSSPVEACGIRAPKIWDAFQRVFLNSLNNGISFIDDFKDLSMDAKKKLDKSCFEFGSSASDNWSVRGISFIEKQPCPVQG